MSRERPSVAALSQEREVTGEEAVRFQAIDFARVVQEMARVARANGLLMPGIRTRPGEEGISVWAGGSTVTIAREHTDESMKRALAESVVKANKVPEGGEAWHFHVHALVASVGHSATDGRQS